MSSHLSHTGYVTANRGAAARAYRNQSINAYEYPTLAKRRGRGRLQSMDLRALLKRLAVERNAAILRFDSNTLHQNECRRRKSDAL